MTALNQVYKCTICGNIVEVLHTGVGELTCCNKAMLLMRANIEDAAEEKHVPSIVKTDTEVKVMIGSDEHPMDKDHYIEWIEVLADNKVYRKFLNPGDKPEAEFDIQAKKVEARAYCNLHGLWKAEL